MDAIHDLIKQKYLHKEYLFYVMEWNSSHKLTVYSFENSYKPFMNLIF